MRVTERRTIHPRSGFTLVEVVVVAVIVAILATVGATLYSAYVRETRQNTVNNLAETAAASANAYFRKTGTKPSQDADLLVSQLNLHINTTKFTVVHTPASNEIKISDESGAEGVATY